MVSGSPHHVPGQVKEEERRKKNKKRGAERRDHVKSAFSGDFVF